MSSYKVKYVPTDNNTLAAYVGALILSGALPATAIDDTESDLSGTGTDAQVRTAAAAKATAADSATKYN